MNESSRILLRLEFDGSSFCGWQLQASVDENKRSSIQGEIEKALQTILRSPQRISVKGCGRTDAGVSACEYFCHFDVAEVPQDLEKFRHALSSVLPMGISVLSAFEVSENFHAADSVLFKTYEYRILLRRAKPSFEAGRSWWIHGDLSGFDVEKLTAASQVFIGEHDFKAFAAANHQAATTIRKIDLIEVSQSAVSKDCLDSGIQIRLRFKARGFLKQMVRNMVGALVEVAQGKNRSEDIAHLLASASDRKDAGFCAPPEGLYLMGVDYGRKF